jgi:hypothetical protein
MSASHAQVDNGVNVQALIDARAALTDAPAGAQFQWRAICTWKKGTHSHSTVKGFFGLGDEQKHKTSFSFDADHPEVFASEDHGATPVEFVLVALEVAWPPVLPRSLSTGEFSCGLYPRPSKERWTCRVRNGFSGIKVTYDIDADATRDEIKALVAQSQKRSAVYDIITNPTNVTVDVK